MPLLTGPRDLDLGSMALSKLTSLSLFSLISELDLTGVSLAVATAMQTQSDQLSAISFLFTSTFLSRQEGTLPIYKKMNFPVHFALKSVGNRLKYLYNHLMYFLQGI